MAEVVCLDCNGVGFSTSSGTKCSTCDGRGVIHEIHAAALKEERARQMQEARARQRKDSSSCFIASAIYGEDAVEVATLRNFRDEILSQSAAGKRFIDLYYRVAPRIASYISPHQNVKLALKAVLRVIVTVVERRLQK